MASHPGPASLNVEQLLQAVEQLSPAEQREFERRLVARQGANGSTGPNDAALIRAACARLPAAADRRLRRLVARSERGRLTAKELADYKSLAQEAQRLDAARAEALAELARRRGQPVQAVRAELDCQGPGDGG